MRIEHIAIYVRDLEGAKRFFMKYFGARSNELYHNPRTGLRSYFLIIAGRKNRVVKNSHRLSSTIINSITGTIGVLFNFMFCRNGLVLDH
ncbi:VOC family protein [Prevotella sp. A2931]|uniref:VOC family protein n=1 Tax=Prevotella illustrans TaxID=2800387 RepID=A0ABS3M6E7_9BACT|nr:MULTISPECIES: VOC family protein [Prevotella]MBO1363695.1 VOC family protein [Prevotella illustrans]PTL26377.1 hypothetical protein C3V39_04525 [Prevotella sp. oral taxon 820]